MLKLSHSKYHKTEASEELQVPNRKIISIKPMIGKRLATKNVNAGVHFGTQWPASLGCSNPFPPTTLLFSSAPGALGRLHSTSEVTQPLLSHRCVSQYYHILWPFGLCQRVLLSKEKCHYRVVLQKDRGVSLKAKPMRIVADCQLTMP